MSLGTSGPPASAKQLAYLQALLAKAGHATFRDARRPLGLTQRQASGKFTSREASALIDRLLNGESSDGGDDAVIEAPSAAQIDVARGLPADLLADELRRRGWHVEPPG